MARLLDRAAFQAEHALENQPALDSIDHVARSTIVHSIVNEVEKRILTWLEENGERVVIRKKLLFLNVTVRVKHLVPIFQAMLNDEQPFQVQSTEIG